MNFARKRTNGLNATSTHDSKRNEDTRCRLATLSETDSEWAALVHSWHERYTTGKASTLGPLDELRAYETLFVLWPSHGAKKTDVIVERAQSYARKAAREAKVRTSWTDPDEQYEQLLNSFISQLCQDREFGTEMSRFSASIESTALCNMLGVVVLKMCCPGVPDLYQGTEFLEPTLTDPDNRRRVDFEARAAALAEMPGVSLETAAGLLAAGQHGIVKLFVTRALLAERRRSPALFDTGAYHGLSVTTEHAVAFARELDGQRLIAVVPRLTYRLTSGTHLPLGASVWADASVGLPEGWDGCYHEVLTDQNVTVDAGRLELGDVLQVLPVAVLRLALSSRPA